LKLVVGDVDDEFAYFNPCVRLLLVELRMVAGANVHTFDLKFFFQYSAQHLRGWATCPPWELMEHRAVFLSKAEKAEAA